MGKIYTQKEIDRLKELNSQGLGPKEIARLLPNRTYSSVKTRLTEMGLSTRQITPGRSPDSYEERLLKRLKKRKYTVIELANEFDVGPKSIKETIYSLTDRGYNLEIEDDTIELNSQPAPRKPLIIDVTKFFGKKIKFGAISDSHLGSKFERLDVLNAMYDIYKREGVKVVLHGGNYVDGEFRFNKFETYTHGFDDMIDNFLKKYPKRKGIKTWFISGDDHEGWWMQDKGIDAGKVIVEKQKEYGRDDLVYLGYQERDIVLKSEKGSALLRLVHAGGGTAYADSYSTQKIVESYQEGEKPHILLVGHYHKAIYHTPRGIHVLQLGCTQDQTRFMRKNKLRAALGGWIITMNQAPTGEINRFQPEFIQFWNKGFYESKIGHEGEQSPLEGKLGG